jgi:hypothetical protein
LVSWIFTEREGNRSTPTGYRPRDEEFFIDTLDFPNPALKAEFLRYYPGGNFSELL